MYTLFSVYRLWILIPYFHKIMFKDLTSLFLFVYFNGLNGFSLFLIPYFHKFSSFYGLTLFIIYFRYLSSVQRKLLFTPYTLASVWSQIIVLSDIFSSLSHHSVALSHSFVTTSLTFVTLSHTFFIFRPVADYFLLWDVVVTWGQRCSWPGLASSSPTLLILAKIPPEPLLRLLSSLLRPFLILLPLPSLIPPSSFLSPSSSFRYQFFVFLSRAFLSLVKYVSP